MKRLQLRHWILILLLAGIGYVIWRWQSPGPDPGGYPIRNYPPSRSKIYMLGDSLTYGIGANHGPGLVQHLSAKLGRPVVNGGVPGDNTAGGLLRIGGILAQKPGTVIILLGGNDILGKKTVEEAERNLGAIIGRCQEAGAMVCLVGVNGRPGDGYKKLFPRLAKQFGCVYVPDILDGIFFEPKLKTDMLHPNSEGYAIMAERIAERLKPYL